MTIEEFEKKHGLDFRGDLFEEFSFFAALDKIYLEFTKEQAIELITDYFLCADDIYNGLQEEAKKATQKLEELFKIDSDTKKEFDA